MRVASLWTSVPTAILATLSTSCATVGCVSDEDGAAAAVVAVGAAEDAELGGGAEEGLDEELALGAPAAGLGCA